MKKEISSSHMQDLLKNANILGRADCSNSVFLKVEQISSSNAKSFYKVILCKIKLIKLSFLTENPTKWKQSIRLPLLRQLGSQST